VGGCQAPGIEHEGGPGRRLDRQPERLEGSIGVTDERVPVRPEDVLAGLIQFAGRRERAVGPLNGVFETGGGPRILPHLQQRHGRNEVERRPQVVSLELLRELTASVVDDLECFAGAA
jgi:hypothetical protein